MTSLILLSSLLALTQAMLPSLLNTKNLKYLLSNIKENETGTVLEIGIPPTVLA